LLKSRHFRNYVYPHPRSLGIHASEVDCMAAPEVAWIKRRNGDCFRPEIRQSLPQTRKIMWFRQDCEIYIAAKLGCAVQYARLAAHKEGADLVLLDRRKDSAYRIRDQAILLT
jgi:hypothetical protein